MLKSYNFNLTRENQNNYINYSLITHSLVNKLLAIRRYFINRLLISTDNIRNFSHNKTIKWMRAESAYLSLKM